VDKRAKINKFFHYRNLLPLGCDCRWLPRAWTFVFCQFTSSPRDVASVAIVSSTGTRSYVLCSSARRATSSAKSRCEKECGPNDTPFVAEPTVLSSSQSTPVEKVWCQNTPLLNSRFNYCEPGRTAENVSVPIGLV